MLLSGCFAKPPGIHGRPRVGLAISPAVTVLVGFTIARERDMYSLNAKGVRGAFEPFLAKYLRISEFIVVLATRSIVLLVDSSALHNEGGAIEIEGNDLAFGIDSNTGDADGDGIQQTIEIVGGLFLVGDYEACFLCYVRFT